MYSKHVKRPSLILILGLFLTAFLVGCGSTETSSTQDDGTAELSFLTMQLRPTFDNYFLPLFEDFEKSHPGVQIKWLDFPYQNYETKLITSFMANNSPDVINLPSDSIRNFARGGNLLPLEGLVAQEVVDSYLPNMVKQGCYHKGALYGFPWYVAGTVTFYNKALLEEAGIDELPTSYDKFPAILKQVQDTTGKFGYFPLYTEGGTLRLYLAEAGISMLNEDGTRAAFNTPRAAEVLTFWTDLYKNKLVPDEAITAMHRRPIEFFKTGRVAMFESGPQFLRQVKSDAPEVYEVTEIGPDLQWSDHDQDILVLQTLVLSKQTKHPDLAAEFAAFVTNTVNQVNFCKEVVILPSTIAALDDPYFTNAEDTPEGKARRISAAQAKTGGLLPIPEEDKKLHKILDEVVEKVCLGKLTSQEALDEAERRWNEILGDSAQ